MSYSKAFPLGLVKPLDVAEILTVWQQVVLWEHTHAGLVCTSLVSFYLALEGVDVAFLLYQFEWCHLVYLAVAGVLVIVEHYELQTYCVVETLLIYGVGDGVALTRLCASVEYCGVR